MLIVPLQAVPAQRIKTVLNDGIVNLEVYQRRYGMFVNVEVNDRLVIGAVIGQNRNRIIRSEYLKKEHNFSGDFSFLDLQGSSDPHFADLGTRYQLAYFTDAEIVTYGIM